MTYLLLVFCHEICVFKTTMPVMSTHKFWNSHPIASFALFKSHEIIEPMIPGKDANALSANLPSSCNRAFSLFFIHSLAPLLFPSPLLVLPDVVGTLGPPSRASIRTPMAIPMAVNMDTIVIPCSLKRVRIHSPSVPVSLSKNFVIDSLI